MEKQKVVNDVIKTFGFTPEQMIEDWLKSEVISKEFLSGLISNTKETKAETLTLIPSKRFETPKLIQPGMFCYADGLIHHELIKNEQISSVVGSVQGNQILSICLREKKRPWSSDCLFLDVDNDITSGKELTKLILEASICKDKEVEAAQYCHEYCEDGVEQGSAFLPSIEELKIFRLSEKTINSSFSKLHVPELKGLYWSSSEYNNNSAWIYCSVSGASLGGLNYNYKLSNLYYVRPAKELFI